MRRIWLFLLGRPTLRPEPLIPWNAQHHEWSPPGARLHWPGDPCPRRNP